jgi:hypothetical protein
VDSNDLSMMYKATYAPEVYRRVHRLVHHEFRARNAKRAWLRRPHHLRRAAAWFYNSAALAMTRTLVRNPS